MNHVNLLMKKEWMYLFKCLKSTWIISLLFMTVFCVLSPQMYLIASIIVPYFLIYGVMAHEENSHSNALNYTLPVSRKEVVLSKYLLGLIYSLVVGVVVTIVVNLGISMQKSYIEVFQTIGKMNVFITLVGSSLLYIALIIPIILKFGCIKMRMVMLLIYGLLFGVSSVAMNIIKEAMNIPIEMKDTLTTIKISSSVGIGILGIILIGYVVSYFISRRIMETKQIVE